MIVNSFNQEFGYELLSALPRAYELYLSGELTETISGVGSEPLYYFSPKHTINKEPRSWFNTEKARLSGLPYSFIHRYERPKLTFPPFKDHYKNTEFKFIKPTLCICNRYNKEWNCDPINFFDEKILDWLFENLKKDYEIIYFAVDLPEDIQDNAHSMPLNDIPIAKKHGIKIFQDINKGKWNESLLKVFANCDHYITMNGGYSIMASFFTGTNIIYSKIGERHTKELDVNSFFRWYPNHNNQRVLAVETYDQLKRKVQAIYIDKLPTANIIMRTSARPYAFQAAYFSVTSQTYPNINLVVTTDGDAGLEYTRKAKARHIKMEPVPYEPKPEGEEWGRHFPYNVYIDRAQRSVNGYILFLDDDDMFTNNDSVKMIMEHAEHDKLLIWKTQFEGNKIVPSKSFGKAITLLDITGIGLCYHSDHVDKTDWTQYKRADYRTAKKLSLTLGVKWLDAILTKLQSKPGMGAKQDIKTYFNKIDKFMKTIRMNDSGKVVRLPKSIAEECVSNGVAVFLSDVLAEMSKPIGKPTVIENKKAATVLENKEIVREPIETTRVVDNKKTFISKEKNATKKPRSIKSK